ncbi:Calx-beta domain-containing protein [Altererythrobacter sp. TH136]|uniref:Calx-beta domain-containing protein n=1 Tax=Altererythrobacter sp. TH136 TaxID=2067415 RepID=UPI001163AC11|nr:Calx-beta domain-containing protein [Altererythrobacter sp. TH136]QDM41003.1 hypothetical protein C0V74_08155 [Altererythrobacter sp. TH136]
MAYPNDEIENAALLQNVQNGSTIGATNSDVWYKYSSASTKTVALNTNGSDYDTYLYVYRKESDGSYTLITSDDDSGDGLDSALSFIAEAGVEYYIAVDGYVDTQGNFLLNSNEVSDGFFPGSVSIANTQLVEGDNGTSQMVFTLTRTGGNAAFSVDASTANVSATAGSDYVANSQTINFAAGQNTATFSVTVNGDTINEVNESFQVNLSGATNGATIGTGTATGTILNDDATFTISGASVVEGNTPVSVVQVQVSRDPANSQFATTLYTQAVAGTATAGSDYDGGTTTVNFAAGQSTAFVSIAIVGDQVIEPNETFTVNLYSNAGRTNLLSSSTVTIVNDDGSSVTNAFGPGNDVLYATSAGGETLAGGNGDDQYLVNSIDDVIIEGPNAGYDTVFTASSYTLNGGSFVESLSTQTHSDTTNINLIGNFHDQLIIGNFGDNVLNGNGGVDTLIGLQGNDTYVVGDAAAQIIENAGEGYDVAYARVSYTLGAGVEVEALSTQTVAETAAIDLTGNEFSQLVIGNMGANVLNGGGGADTLIGLGGADTFAFTTALGANNVDTIQDFEAGVDQISLSSSIFGNLATGELSATAFTVGTQATTADQRIVYDQATGKLFYDADGSGSGEAVLFAQVAPGTIITPADMVVTP